MSFNKAKKGKNWKKLLEIWEQGENGQWENSGTSSLKSLVKKIDLDIQATKVIRIYYYGSEMPQEQRQAEEIAVAAGVVGAVFAAIGAYVLGPAAAATVMWKKALGAAGLAIGGTAAVGGVTIAECADTIVFHGYIVIECSNGVWLGLDKLEDVIHVRICRDASSAINFRGQKEQRKNPSFLCGLNAKAQISVHDLFAWIIENQLPRPYNYLRSNCKHFCFDLAQEFGHGENPLPDFLALKLKQVVGKQKMV